MYSGRRCVTPSVGDINGEDGFEALASELRKVRRCWMKLDGELRGEGVVIELLASDTRNARGLKNKSPNSPLGRRLGALGRLMEGILKNMSVG